MSNAWDRQQGEPNLWFDRFTRYRLQGARRSVESVFAEETHAKGRKTKRPHTGWYSAAAKWNWRERAEAWDEAERQRLEAEWEERRAQIRERDYKQAQVLRDLADRIMEEGPKFLRATKRTTKGGTEIVTIALDAKLGIQALETASKLQRLAAEMIEPQRMELTDRDGKPVHIVLTFADGSDGD